MQERPLSFAALSSSPKGRGGCDQREQTEREEIEVRHRTETRTGTRTVTDPETGETSTETYEYEVEVAYNYYILNVKLTNKPVSEIAEELLTPSQSLLTGITPPLRRWRI